MISLRSIAACEPDQNDRSRNDRSYSSSNMLFHFTRGGGPSVIDVKEPSNRAGGARSNEAKVSPLDQRELESSAL